MTTSRFDQIPGPTESMNEHPQKISAESPIGYINFYRHRECPLRPGIAWADDWTAMCDDECPACGACIGPYRSADAETGEEVL